MQPIWFDPSIKRPPFGGLPVRNFGPHGLGPTGPGGAPLPDRGPMPRDPVFFNEGRAGVKTNNWILMKKQMEMARQAGLLDELNVRGVNHFGNPQHTMNRYEDFLPAIVRMARKNGYFGHGSIKRFLRDRLADQGQKNLMAVHKRIAP